MKVRGIRKRSVYALKAFKTSTRQSAYLSWVDKKDYLRRLETKYN